MKTKILIVLLTIFCFQLRAEISNTKLVVWKSDGSSETFLLEDKPITSFNEEGLTINTERLSVTYPLSKVLRYTYSGVTTEAESILGENNINIYFIDNTLILENLQEGISINIYTLNSLLLHSFISTNENKTVISLEEGSNGFYIIKVGNTSYKVLKK